MDWFHLALVSMVSNLWLHKKQGISRLFESLLALQVGLCSMYLIMFISASIIQTILDEE